jgi:hypothetical protein
MVVYIDDAFFRRRARGQAAHRDDIVAAHAEGTVQRLRPKLMTIVTMAAALLPLLWRRARVRDHEARGGADGRRPGDQRLPDPGGHPRALHDLARAAAAGRAGASDARRRGAGHGSDAGIGGRSRSGKSQVRGDRLGPVARKRWKSLIDVGLVQPWPSSPCGANVRRRRCRATERAGNLLVVVANEIQLQHLPLPRLSDRSTQ